MKIYDILLKNGTIIDPSNKINSKLDIAISSTKIAKVSKLIDESDTSILNNTTTVTLAKLVTPTTITFCGTAEVAPSAPAGATASRKSSKFFLLAKFVPP